MSIEELRERADTLRAEALALVDGPVGEVLREVFGAYEIAGSVALDLMVWRDIDLYVRAEATDAARLLAALPHLATALADAGQPVSRIAYRDEHLEPDPAFPGMPGLYLGISTAGGWKIDLWGWDSSRFDAQHQGHRDLAAALKDADRDLVLSLKDATRDRPDYSSVGVYEFVLAHADTTIEDYERFRR